MPLFSTNKFSQKKTPQRKISGAKRKPGGEDDFKFEVEKIKINIGEQSAVFEDGDWIPESGVSGQRVDHQRTKQQLKQLEMENNMLKLKTEVLLDMEELENHQQTDDISTQTSFREVFENTFPELKAKRKVRERLAKNGFTCRSEADLEAVAEMLKKEHSIKMNAAEIPDLQAGPAEWNRACICMQGERSGEENKFGVKYNNVINSFLKTNDLFVEEFRKHPKDFGKIASAMNRSVNDCVLYYYMTKMGKNCGVL